MKRIFFFIFFSYCIFFFLTQPAQTPDEMGHYETVYWVSQGIYPFASETFAKNEHPYGADIASLFNFGNENPMLVLNFNVIKNSSLQQKTKYTSQQYATYIPQTGQAYNPPLYYIVSAIFLRLATYLHSNLIRQFYIARLASALFYFGTVYVFYKILRLLFNNKKVVNGLLLAFALNPLFIQCGIGMSPDIAVGFFSTLFMWLVLRYSSKKQITECTVFMELGVVVGLAALCKITGIFLVPAFVVYTYFKKETIRIWLKSIFIFLLTCFIVQVPWLILNMIRYHKLFVDTIALGAVESPMRSTSVFTAIVITLIDFRHTFMHFSGFLGWNDAYPFSPVFWSYTIIFILTFFIGMWNVWKYNRMKYLFQIFLTISVFLFLFIFSFERKIYFHPGWGIGGRNILPIFPSLILFSGIGIAVVLKRKLEELAPMMGMLSVGYYYYILVFVLLPRYYV